MTQKRIFVALSTFGEYGRAPIDKLESQGYDLVINRLGRRPKKDEILSMGADCEGVIAGVECYDKSTLKGLPNLSCISRCGVGIDNIDLNTAKSRNIKVLNTPDVVIQPVAELALAMIFDLLRKLTFHTQIIKNQKWQKKAGHLLSEQTIGILGLGRIGKRVSELLVNLGARVYGADLHPDLEWAKKVGVSVVSVDQLLEISDILSLHLSIFSDRPFLLDASAIQKMKKGALLVNVSRGTLIDEGALKEALSSGHIGGAALDVYQREPYTGDLSHFDNVVLTPHIATLTEESRLQMEYEAADNLIQYFNSLSPR